MQYLWPVGAGPSGNLWPKCELHWEHTASSRTIPWLRSSIIEIEFGSIVSKKLGHPDPDSYFVLDEKRAWLHTAHPYIPVSLQSQYFPVKGLSVPPPQQITFCSAFKWSVLNFSSILVWGLFMKSQSIAVFANQKKLAFQNHDFSSLISLLHWGPSFLELPCTQIHQQIFLVMDCQEVFQWSRPKEVPPVCIG